jgi:hypothetical protein
MNLKKEFSEAPRGQKFLFIVLGIFMVYYIITQVIFKNVLSGYFIARRALVGVEQKLETAAAIHDNWPALKNREKKIEKQLNKMLLSRNESSLRFGQSLQKSGLKLVSLIPLKPKEQHFWLTKSYKIQLEGSIAQFQKYLAYIYAARVAYKVNELTFVRVDKKNYKYFFQLELFSLPEDIFAREEVSIKRLVRKSDFQSFKLQGFWGSGKQTKVFINDKLLKTGDTIEGYRLGKIVKEKGYVVLYDLKTNSKTIVNILK